MIADELEFQISQYVDGTLSPEQKKSVEDQVARDPQAKKVLADYRCLNAGLANVCAAPAIRWDWLADQISSRIDRDESPAVAGRIGFSSTPLRIAAALLLAATALIVTRLSVHHRPAAVLPAVTPPSVSIVSGPEAEVATGQPSAEVSVGPSAALAARDSRYGEGVISRGPSKVVIVGMTPKKPLDSHQ